MSVFSACRFTSTALSEKTRVVRGSRMKLAVRKKALLSRSGLTATSNRAGGTRMAAIILPAEVWLWISRLASVLHQTNAWRLGRLLAGMLFSRGRRTVASWLRAGGLSNDYQGYYYFLGSVGRKVKLVAGVLLRWALQVVHP